MSRWWRRGSATSGLRLLLEQAVDEADGAGLVVAQVARGGVGEGIAGKEALVEDLAAAERGAGDVPGQAEEADPLPAAEGRGLEVGLDVGTNRALDGGLVRDRHQAARADELQ